MYEILLIDLDDTILDFKKQEHVAIERTLSGVGIEPTGQICQLYSQINDAHWKRLEKGEITRQQVLHGRFEVLFAELGVQGDAVATAQAYMEHLSQGHYYLPGAEETVAQLSKSYRLFLASNGTASVQLRRIANANLERWFEGVFISQNVGVNKPAKGYFDYCFAHIPGFDREKTMIVGDSLSSDIRGGQNAGITTCWINPEGKPCTLERAPDYQLQSLSRLPGLLKNL